MLSIGTIAPDFELLDQNGDARRLSDYRGQRVILYFYPKDMTSGCTKQACAFGELYPQFLEKGAVVTDGPKIAAVGEEDALKKAYPDSKWNLGTEKLLKE